MEANSSSSQLRDHPGSKGKDGQLFTLAENGKHLRYLPFCRDDRDCSCRPLTQGKQSEGLRHHEKYTTWRKEVRAGGFAILGDLQFILHLCGGKNGRKHMTRPNGLEKCQY